MRKELNPIVVSICVLAVMSTPCWLAFCNMSHFLKLERQASDGNKALQEWTAVECKSVWEFAVEVCENTDERRIISQAELPLLLQKIGFNKATVTPDKFDARLGGSSFGRTPAMVFCWPSGDEHKSLPRMFFGLRHYDPKLNKIVE